MSAVANKTQRSLSPIDGSIFDERDYSSAHDLQKVINTAKNASALLKNTCLQERIKICESALQYFSDNKSEMAREISIQMGRPIIYAPFEIDGAIARARHMIEIAEASLADKIIASDAGCKKFIQRVPHGVVFVVAPWNYPYLTAINTIIPAILSGNSVILKHAAQTPWCADRFTQAFACFPAALQSVCLDHAQVASVVAHEDIDYVAFTGSVKGGRAIAKAATNKFMHLGLELGGKDPAYVRADVDFNFAVQNLVDGVFFNSGQSCCAVERIYVDYEIFDDFVCAFSDLARKYKVADPLLDSTTLGPMVRKSAADFVCAQVSQAVSAGAKTLLNLRSPGGAFCMPEVLVGVNHTMSIMRDESFGPVVGIMPVNSDRQAVDLMNDSEFGLTASVWSQDLSKSTEILNQINAGTCFLNRCDYLDPALAWTGVKNSGVGISLSDLGFMQLTKAKSFYLRCD